MKTDANRTTSLEPSTHAADFAATDKDFERMMQMLHQQIPNMANPDDYAGASTLGARTETIEHPHPNTLFH
jgi:hypothetical protein